ncbi:unnamed protein product [Lymnaea stagnalis]|uniref:BHLH domain-containing protein n=1 Tax=Lymnaea stagnalis TaxID=6523 RepID=A0AAV2HG02_LYMST
MVPLVVSSSKNNNFYNEEFTVKHFNACGETQDRQSSSIEELATHQSSSIEEFATHQSSSIEEFATHLSLYDDHIHFVDRTASVTSRVSEGELEGPIPPSIFFPVSKKDDDVTEPVKVKRKCGRPRNPIPRHKRESHINAEHRRRGKIQNGFRTLKCLVPKYDQSSGRDSKADILFKAVDHCKLLQHDINELSLSMDAVRAEKETLGDDIKNYQKLVPDPNVYDQLASNINDRFEDYVHQRSNEYRTFWAFTFILRPLFESYKTRVSGTSIDDLLRSVSEWTENTLTVANLGDACMTLLREVGSDAAVSRDQGSSVDAQVDSRGASEDLPSKSVMHRAETDAQICSSKNADPLAYNSPVMMTPHVYSPTVASTCSPPVGGIHTYGTHATAHYSPSSVPFSPDHHSINAGDALAMNPGMSSGASDSVCSSLADDSRILSNPSPHLAIQHSEVLPFNSPYTEVQYSHEHDQPLQQQGDYHGSNPGGLDFWQSPQSHYTGYTNQPQPSHYHTDHIVPTTGNFLGVGKGHWSAQSYMAEELDNTPSMYYANLNGVSDRDTKHDSYSSHNAAPPSPLGSSPEQEHRSHLTYQYHRQKSYSLSSTESDGSLLSIGSYSRPAAELFKDQEKYCQLSPSTDGCLSPGSNGQLDSPCAGIERAAQELSFHDAPIGLDHYNKIQSNENNYYTVCVNSGQLAPSLPSYRDTFGSRDLQKNKQSLPNLDAEVPLIASGTKRLKEGAGVTLATNGTKRIKEGSIWQKIRKMGSSSLLAELLAPTKKFGLSLASSRPGDNLTYSKEYPVSECSTTSLSSSSHQTFSDNRPQTPQSIHQFWDNPSDGSFLPFPAQSSKSTNSKHTKPAMTSFDIKMKEQINALPQLASAGHALSDKYSYTQTDHNDYSRLEARILLGEPPFSGLITENHRQRKDEMLLYSQESMASSHHILQNCSFSRDPSFDDSNSKPNRGFPGYDTTSSIMRSAIFGAPDGIPIMSGDTKDGTAPLASSESSGATTLNRKISFEDSFPDQRAQSRVGAFKRVCYWTEDLHGGNGIHLGSPNCGIETSLPRSDNPDRKPVESQG